jgi:GDP-L-fucose synthase
MPTNLYGENDNFHAENSHVIPAMINRFHQAKLAGAKAVEIWGTGTPRREFLHVADMADACCFVMNLPREEYQRVTEDRLSHLNVGSGEDCTIAELASTIAEVVGFQGELTFDTSKPDGTPRKLLQVDKLRKLGWRPSIGLKEGLSKTYTWYLDNYADLRGLA